MASAATACARGVCAAGAIVHYLRHELRRSLAHITRLQVYRNAQYMIVDATTQANLELVQARGGAKDTSLLGALDRTVTPMGARKLRDWMLHPLCDLAPLEARQQVHRANCSRSRFCSANCARR